MAAQAGQSSWPYFFFAWQVKEQTEKDRLREEALRLLEELEGRYHAYALFELFEAYSDGDDIIVCRGRRSEVRGTRNEEGGTRIPCLRQQQGKPPYLCLADFIYPKEISPSSFLVPPSSKIGVFATSVDMGLETDFSSDAYQKMLAQLLADRLAEAAAERVHEQVRKEFWGYAKDEQLTIPEMHIEKFQGIRPAVGYPSLPDASLNFILDDLLDMKQIAHYFSIGKIGEDQLRDYARRRGLPIEVCRKFLAANL